MARSVGVVGSRRDDSSNLRIGTMNIAHGRGLSESNWTDDDDAARRDRLLDIARNVEELELDVVVLNEVDFDALWSNGGNQAEIIAQTVGYRYVVEVPNYDFLLGPCRFRWGNAVLSRFPLRDAEIIDLPSYSRIEAILGGKKRGIAVTVETPGGPVRLFAVHLSHRSESLRVDSAQLLVALTRQTSLPVIIAGDTNSTPTGFPDSTRDERSRNAMDLLAEAELFQWRPTGIPEQNELTFPSPDPSLVIDWVLVPLDWEIESYRAIAWELSDHRPVVTQLQR